MSEFLPNDWRYRRIEWYKDSIGGEVFTSGRPAQRNPNEIATAVCASRDLDSRRAWSRTTTENRFPKGTRPEQQRLLNLFWCLDDRCVATGVTGRKTGRLRSHHGAWEVQCPLRRPQREAGQAGERIGRKFNSRGPRAGVDAYCGECKTSAKCIRRRLVSLVPYGRKHSGGLTNRRDCSPPYQQRRCLHATVA